MTNGTEGRVVGGGDTVGNDERIVIDPLASGSSLGQREEIVVHSGFRRHFQVVDDLIHVHDTVRLQPGDRFVGFAVDDAGKRHGAVVDQDVNRIVADRVVP